MRFLYVVFILSTAALLWAAYAIARTVRRHGRQAQGPTLSLRLDAQQLDSEHSAEIDPEDAGPPPGSSASGHLPT
jgi:hypothetical protein